MPDLREALETALASMKGRCLRHGCLCEWDENGTPVGEHTSMCWKSVHEDAIKAAEEALAEADKKTPLHEWVAGQVPGRTFRPIEAWGAVSRYYRGRATAFAADLRSMEADGLIERDTSGDLHIFRVTTGGKGI